MHTTRAHIHCFPIRPTLPSTHSRFDNLKIVTVSTSVILRLRPTPQHDTAKVTHPRRHRALDNTRHIRRLEVSLTSTISARRRADVQLGSLARDGAVAAQVIGPGFEGVDEARLPDVAAGRGVVVELDEDEVHRLHGRERDGGVRARALGRAGDVVLLGRVARVGAAEGGDERVVVLGAVVFVVDVEAVELDRPERSHVGVGHAAPEEVPEVLGEAGSLRVAAEVRDACSASETQQDFLAEALAGGDVLGEERAVQ